MIFGAIVAGGIGSRLNISDAPKQFLPLGDKPIIIHTLEKFMLCSRFDHIYIGVHPDWQIYMADLVEKYIGKPDNIHIVAGGKDRNSTILNIIEAIENNHGVNEENVIVTHDSVRPFVTLRMINDNIDAALKYGACDTATGAIDTIVVSEDGNYISEIPNRAKMYQGQTPQSFKISLLKRLYNDLSEEEKLTLTDACKICTVRNTPVYLVEGEISNIKITTVSDYKIAQAMVGGVTVD